ncbi:hypothetical protein ACFL6M_03985, partial [Candidatus Eisenbacteria bacterium]
MNALLKTLSPTALVLLLATPMMQGCSGPSDAPDTRSSQLTGVPLSADLQPALEAAREALDTPDPENQVARDIDTFNDLSVCIQRPASRQDAGDE